MCLVLYKILFMHNAIYKRLQFGIDIEGNYIFGYHLHLFSIQCYPAYLNINSNIIDFSVISFLFTSCKTCPPNNTNRMGRQF